MAGSDGVEESPNSDAGADGATDVVDEEALAGASKSEGGALVSFLLGDVRSSNREAAFFSDAFGASPNNESTFFA